MLFHLIHATVLDMGLPLCAFFLFFVLRFFSHGRKYARWALNITVVFIFLSFIRWTPSLFQKPLLIPGVTDVPSVHTNSYIDGQLPECMSGVKNIVIVGSGVQNPDYLESVTYLKLQGLLELYRENKFQIRTLVNSGQMKILFSGYGPAKGSDDQKHSEASLMGQYFLDHISSKDIAHGALLLEEESQNTSENAEKSMEIFKKDQLDRRIALVTAKWHLRRASKDFRRAGFQVCPVPTRQHFLQSSGTFHSVISYRYGIDVNQILGESAKLLWSHFFG